MTTRTFKQHLDARSAPPMSPEEFAERIGGLLDEQIAKLLPPSIRKSGRKISGPRLAKLKEMLAILKEVIAEAENAPADAVVVSERLAKAVALGCAALNLPQEDVMPTTVSFRKAAKIELDRAADLILKRNPSLSREAAAVQALEENPAIYETYDVGVARGEAPEFAENVSVAKVYSSSRDIVWQELRDRVNSRMLAAPGKWNGFDEALAQFLNEPEGAALYDKYEAASPDARM